MNCKLLLLYRHGNAGQWREVLGIGSDGLNRYYSVFERGPKPSPDRMDMSALARCSAPLNKRPISYEGWTELEEANYFGAMANHATELTRRAEAAEAELHRVSVEWMATINKAAAAEARVKELEAQQPDMRTRPTMDAYIELQKHRDAWRSYAYGRGPRPLDFLDVSRSMESTALERAEARVKALEGLCAKAPVVLNGPNEDVYVKFQILDDLRAAGRGEEVRPDKPPKKNDVDPRDYTACGDPYPPLDGPIHLEPPNFI